MSIGTKLKELRDKKGIPQRIIADYLGIKVNSYSQYENDIRKPSYETLTKIADYYNVILTGLIDFDNEPIKSDSIVIKELLIGYMNLVLEAQDIMSYIDAKKSFSLDAGYDIQDSVSDYKALLSQLDTLHEKLVIKRNILEDYINLCTFENMVSTFISNEKTNHNFVLKD